MIGRTVRLYCATDKEVFDVLESSKKRITEGAMYELGRKRGIFYSKETDREDVILHYSTISHDHYSLKDITEFCGKNKRPDNIASKALGAEISFDTINNAVNKIKANDENENIYKVEQLEDGHVRVSVIYNDFDYGKTSLAQIKREEAIIDFKVIGNKTRVRLPATRDAEKIYKIIKDEIQEGFKETIKASEIEIPAGWDADKKTRFFFDLMTGIAGYSFFGASNLKVAILPPKIEADSEDDLDGDASPRNGSVDIKALEEIEGIKSSDDEEDDDDSVAETKLAMLSYIQKIALQGQNVQRDPEYIRLRDAGYFITSLTWRSKRTEGESGLVVCTAGFQDGVAGKGFKFAVKGYHKPVENGFSKYIKPLDKQETEKLMTAIEECAERVLVGLDSEADSHDEGENEKISLA